MGYDNSKPMDLERECETWDWARTAGVSEEELRSAVQRSLATGTPSYAETA
jgi:hypothetical protein